VQREIDLRATARSSFATSSFTTNRRCRPTTGQALARGRKARSSSSARTFSPPPSRFAAVAGRGAQRRAGRGGGNRSSPANGTRAGEPGTGPNRSGAASGPGPDRSGLRPRPRSPPKSRRSWRSKARLLRRGLTAIRRKNRWPRRAGSRRARQKVEVLDRGLARWSAGAPRSGSCWPSGSRRSSLDRPSGRTLPGSAAGTARAGEIARTLLIAQESVEKIRGDLVEIERQIGGIEEGQQGLRTEPRPPRKNSTGLKSGSPRADRGPVPDRGRAAGVPGRSRRHGLAATALALGGRSPDLKLLDSG